MNNELKKKVQESINKNKLTEFMLIDLSNKILRRPYINGEKIDVVFIFQSPSFWPSWESFWKACIEDKRINPIMLVSDDPIKEKVQFANARIFLDEIGINYKHISEVDLSILNPHIIVLHTPYDGHRPRYLHGKQLTAKGHRTIYIPYGIEISDISRARNDHFTGGVTTTAWRVYTFSKEMIPYYKMFSPTGGDMVRSFGHPKFDLSNKKHFPSLPDDILKKARGRKVLLLKVHFPKKVNGKMITPSIDMYVNFIKTISSYQNLFCIFMPHPKFYEELANFKNVDEFKEIISGTENMVEFTEDDYRPVLMNCDYYIVDRSALMVEAGVTGKPILYVSTKDPEPMTRPVQKIVDSYYQASTGKEIKKFMDEVVLLDEDPLKDEREEIFNSIILDMKGKSGYLIKEDMVNSLINDSVVDLSSSVISDEFKQLITDLYNAQEIQEVKLEEERQKVEKLLENKNALTNSDIEKIVLDLFKNKEKETKQYVKDLQLIKDSINNSSNSFNDEFKNFIKDLYEAKDIEDVKIELAKEQVKSHLSYRLGQAMIAATKEPFGLIKLPWRIKQVHNDFKKNRDLAR